MPGRIEVEDVADALDVEPARRDVRRDEDVDVAVLEAVEFGDAARLIHVAVNLARAIAVPLQRLGEFAHRRLAVAEDDRGGDALFLDQVAQRIALGALAGLDEKLGNVHVGARGPRHLDRLGIRQEFVGKLLDRRRHRRGEEQGLAIRRQLGADILDVGDEPHVEHPVRLVDDEHVAAGEQDLAALEQVHQAARRRDQHVDALFERLDLIAHLHAADQQRHRKLVIPAVILEILGHLRGKLARRFEDQRARHQRAGAALREDVDHRQHERGGLAGPRLGDADHVAHHQDRRDRSRLNRCRFVIARFGDSAQKFIGEAEVGKFHKGQLSG